jgi:hypothetical protein
MAMVTAVVGIALFVWAKRREARIGYVPAFLALAAHGIVFYALFGIDTRKLDEMDGMRPLLVAMIGLAVLPIAGLWALVCIWRTSGDR